MGKQCLPSTAEQAAGLSTPAMSVDVVIVHGLGVLQLQNEPVNEWWTQYTPTESRLRLFVSRGVKPVPASFNTIFSNNNENGY